LSSIRLFIEFLVCAVYLQGMCCEPCSGVTQMEPSRLRPEALHRGGYAEE
jgi:hypothetical protein